MQLLPATHSKPFYYPLTSIDEPVVHLLDTNFGFLGHLNLCGLARVRILEVRHQPPLHHHRSRRWQLTVSTFAPAFPLDTVPSGPSTAPIKFFPLYNSVVLFRQQPIEVIPALIEIIFEVSQLPSDVTT